MADDLGYSDLGSYGGEIKTPNIDQLAERGVRFTQMYNSARCSPSRASLMTGLYPHQAGIGFFAGDRPDNPRGYRGKLQPKTVTIAEVLKKAGYNTYMTGKWHVGDPVPTEQGFDEFYGFTHGYAANAWNEDMMVRLPEGSSTIDYEEGEFFDTDAFTDYALKFIKQSQQESPDKPWFTFVSHHAPHFPVQAPKDYINKYKDKYKDGWDQIRQERLERMKRIGIVDEDTELSPRSSIMRPEMAREHGVPGEDLQRNPAWSEIPDDRQKDLARRMAVYAGMVDNMDHNVGRIVDHLRKTGELDNTIILFVSDNGACAEWGPYGFDLPDRMLAANDPGYGIGGGTPGLPSKLHEGEELEKMGGPGTGIAYGSGWANVSNTPWSEYKHYAYEGGVGTPFIVSWPNEIKGEHQGAIREQVSYLFDITDTIYDAADAEYPDTYDGEEVLSMEGKSLLPVAHGETLEQRPIIYEHSGNGGIRMGKWKLVGKDILTNTGMAENPVWNLYNIEEDRSEIYDLSKMYPEVVQRMKKKFLEEAKRTFILPRPGYKETIDKEEDESVES
jgi:arylsulfatase